MITKKMTSVVAAALLVSLSAVGFTAEEKMEALDEAKEKVRAAAMNTKGMPRANLDFHRARLNDMIDALERGEAVTAEEVDREIRRANELAR